MTGISFLSPITSTYLRMKPLQNRVHLIRLQTPASSRRPFRITTQMSLLSQGCLESQQTSTPRKTRRRGWRTGAVTSSSGCISGTTRQLVESTFQRWLWKINQPDTRISIPPAVRSQREIILTIKSGLGLPALRDAGKIIQIIYINVKSSEG